MSTLAKALRFDDSMMWVELTDGRLLGVPLAYFPRLLEASPEQRAGYVLSGGGAGIHWDALDEDIAVDGLLAGRGDMTRHQSALAQPPAIYTSGL